MSKGMFIVVLLLITGCQVTNVTRPKREAYGQLSIDRDLETNKTRASAKLELKLSR